LYLRHNLTIIAPLPAFSSVPPDQCQGVHTTMIFVSMPTDFET
jgi:hypothetical protein